MDIFNEVYMENRSKSGLLNSIDSDVLLRVANSELTGLSLMQIFLYLIYKHHNDVYQLKTIPLESSLVAPNSRLLNEAILKLLVSNQIHSFRKFEVISVLSSTITYYGGINISWITTRF